MMLGLKHLQCSLAIVLAEGIADAEDKAYFLSQVADCV